MSLAALSRGSVLQLKISGVYTTIPECGDITFPGPNREEIDVTSQDSPSGSKEFLAGDIDYGEISVEVNYVAGNAVHQALLALASSASQTAQDWKILYLSGTKSCTFSGWVKGFIPTAPVSGVFKSTLTIRCTGAPTYA